MAVLRMKYLPGFRQIFVRALKAVSLYTNGFLVVALSAAATGIADTAPRFVTFTYLGNPSTTLAVNWQTTDKPSEPPQVLFSRIPRGDENFQPQSANGRLSQIEGLGDRWICKVRLTGLLPDTTYYLYPKNEKGIELEDLEEFKIKTIPEDGRPFRFVTGGDMGTSEKVRTLLKHAAAQDPLFAAVGGDIAYADGKLEKVEKWDIWLTYYTEEMVTSEGYHIPLVLAVGNHETLGSFEQPTENAVFFRGFFDQDSEQNHFSRRFGKHLALLVLDSGHTATHESQAEWIRGELTRFDDVTHTAAIYHVPLYPSHRSYFGHYSEKGREYWAPLFDEYGLTVAFENHDHTYKRSHLLKDGKVQSKNGVLYLGDGCWGRNARPVSYEERWYVKHSASVLHFWSVDVSEDDLVYKAIDLENRVFDVYPESHPDSENAAVVRNAIQSKYFFPEESLDITGFDVSREKWLGGAAIVKVVNPFDHILTYVLKPRGNADRMTMEGFPGETFRLKPGEVRTHSVEFTPLPSDPEPQKKLRPGYRLLFHLHVPDEQPVELQAAGRFWFR